MFKINSLFIICFSMILLSSCDITKELIYFQDRTLDTEIQNQEINYIRLQPNEKLSIFVKSKYPELTTDFNYDSIHTVNEEGYITYPILGDIKVVNLKEKEVKELIENALIEKELIKDALVDAQFLDLNYTILGEIASPGTYDITTDYITIIDAISKAGDLTNFSKRDGIFLTRIVDNKRITYQLDFTSAKMYDSPGFYLQQNDFIYVEPNKFKPKK